MKHIIFPLLLIALVAFESCFKKGEDDPFVSLRTRKDRVAGKWMVTSIQSSGISSHRNDNINKNYYDFNGSEYIDSFVFVFNNQVRETRVKKGKRKIYYEFDKNRSYRMYDYTDNDTTIQKGTWTFNDKSEYLKKKLSIFIYPSETYSTNYYFDGNRYLSQASGGSYLCTMRELRHNKMVWEEYREYKPDITGTNHLESTDNAIITLEPK